MIVGFEIRDKLVNFVGEKIRAKRVQSNECDNISVLRTNSMRHFTNYFRENQLESVFICFPDPHFKAQNFRRRIINFGFLSEYAFALKKGGRLYCITDVKELYDWHLSHLERHSLFRRIPEEDLKEDNAWKCIFEKTEEGIKVERNKGQKYGLVYECVK